MKPEDKMPPFDMKIQMAVERLALRPQYWDKPDFEELQALGWSDRKILDFILVIGFFSMINRVVAATGCNLEADYEQYHPKESK